MQGSAEIPGVVSLTVTQLLARMEHLADAQLSMSYLEVYLDRCYDLLVPKGELNVLDDGRGQVSVPNLATVSTLEPKHEGPPSMHKHALNV